MSWDIEMHLDNAVQQVLEGLLFLEATPVAEETPVPGIGWKASLEIQGHDGGELSFRVSSGDGLQLLRSLPHSTNMPEDEALADLFAELVNTVGGRFAASLSRGSAFDLSIPTVDKGEALLESDGIIRTYVLDSAKLHVHFRPIKKA